MEYNKNSQLLWNKMMFKYKNNNKKYKKNLIHSNKFKYFIFKINNYKLKILKFKIQYY